MNAGLQKILAALAIAALPFIAGCVSEAERQRIAAEKAEQARLAKLERQRIAAEKAEQARLAKLEQERLERERREKAEAERQRLAAEKAERERLAKLEQERLERERREKAEAERQRIAAEKAEQARLAKLEQERLERERREKQERLEKQGILNRLQSEIFPAEERLSEEERSRGRALLDAFGDEHMPALAERCRDARKAYLESEAGFKALFAVLKKDNIDPKTNDVFQTAERNYLDKAADYWRLRYKLTDCYSQFKIGVVTADELAARDKEFAEQ